MHPALFLRILLVATALVLSDVLTIERTDTCPDEHLPSLIGLPLPYRTSIPWVNSMSGVLYVQGLLVNIASWALLLAGITLGLTRLIGKAQQLQRPRRVAGMVLTVLAAAFILLFLLFIEWRVEWSPDLDFRCPGSAVRFLHTGR
ncbi:MAG TPA: hypothetical protein PLN54_09710 [Flavobacteriales bacterium]|nr:hypothetical protein [Flavobacteriales bacterium]